MYLFPPHKFQTYCLFETWLLQGPICQQFSLIFATNAFEINCGVLSDITHLGGHRKQIILLTSTVMFLWSEPLLSSVRTACLCKSQQVPLIGVVCFLPCQEAALQQTLWSFPGPPALQVFLFCIHPWWTVPFGAFIELQPHQSTSCCYLFSISVSSSLSCLSLNNTWHKSVLLAPSLPSG